MQLDDRTPEQIKQDILDRLKTDIEKREGSFAQDIIGPTAMELWNAKEARRAWEGMFYVDENSGPYIDKAAKLFGITARKPGAKARAVLHFTGADGTQIPAGKVFLADDLEFILLETVTLADGTGQGIAEAAQEGKQYNVAAGQITGQYENIPGLTAVQSDAATGGIDPETDAALVDRLYEHIQNPATSGNKNHYIQWAKEVPGVGDAEVVPQMEGPGTVGIILVDQDRQPVEPEVVEACAAHIDVVKPIGPRIIVQSAQDLVVDLSATVQLAEGTSAQQVQGRFSEAMREYLQNIALVQPEIIYNRVAYMLLDIEGVVDYTALTINGGTQNVEIPQYHVPVLGTVEVTAA